MQEEYKGYIVWRDKTYCHWHIRHDGKGSVPDALTGSYTKKNLALLAIDAYRNEQALEAPVEAKVGRPKAA